jgi:hypothetical protein
VDEPDCKQLLVAINFCKGEELFYSLVQLLASQKLHCCSCFFFSPCTLELEMPVEIFKEILFN